MTTAELLSVRDRLLVDSKPRPTDEIVDDLIHHVEAKTEWEKLPWDVRALICNAPEQFEAFLDDAFVTE